MIGHSFLATESRSHGEQRKSSFTAETAETAEQAQFRQGSPLKPAHPKRKLLVFGFETHHYTTRAMPCAVRVVPGF